MTLQCSRSDNSPYDILAGEYYNKDTHPTCWNFRQLSLKFFLREMHSIVGGTRTKIVETGAGRSIFCEPNFRPILTSSELIVQDHSAAMLSHSRSLESKSKFLVCDAANIPLDDESIDFVVSGLADPYNNERLWIEAFRLLKAGGYWIVTTPAHDWTTKFRDANDVQRAEFQRTDGSTVYVPSFTFEVHHIIAEISKLNGRLESYWAARINAIDGHISEKLKLKVDTPVLDCFLFRKLPA